MMITLKHKLYKILAGAENCPDTDYGALEELLPSGSGFDVGSTVDWEKTNAGMIVIDSAYHHMDDNGFYDRWSHFKIIVKASMVDGFDITLRSFGPWPRKYVDTKEYILDTFWEHLDKDVTVEWEPGSLRVYKPEW